MRNFDGKPWTPPKVKRRAVGGPTPYDPQGSPFMPGESAGLPTPTARRLAGQPQMAAPMTGQAAPPQGSMASFAMTGLDFVKRLIAQRKAAAQKTAAPPPVDTLNVRGGGRMKGKTGNAQRPNKQAPTPKKAAGGKMKKGC